VPDLLFSARARADLLDIWLTVSEDNGDDTADRIIDGLLQASQVLCEFPAAGRVEPQLRDNRLRLLNYRQWRIVYLVMADSVTVVRIVHAARDLGRLGG
jgi:plasmid stabilization system protein ParE